MKISKDLRLVIPVETEYGSSFVHAQAVGKDTFDRYFVIIAQAFSNIYRDGVSWHGGPRVAARYIRAAAEAKGVKDEVESGLIGEMVRLANVSVRGATGEDGKSPTAWEMVPLYDAFKKGLVDDDVKDEVENALAFFTLASCMHRKNELEAILGGAMDLWGGRLIPSSFTEFHASLPTSTAIASSGEKAPASSAIY